jgi:hypothetical protein
MHETFLAAIYACHSVQVTFCAEDGEVRTRTGYPMDFGPGRRFKDGLSRYWFWDCDSPGGPHAVGLLPSQVHSILETDRQFAPASFVSWPCNWHVSRDWGAFS